MPIIDPNATIFKTIKFGDSSSGFSTYMCKNNVLNESMSISPLKLTFGTANTPFRNIGDRQTEYTFSGPCLIETIHREDVGAFTTFLNDDASVLDQEGDRIYDIPKLIIDFLLYDLSLDNKGENGETVVINSMNLTFGPEGLSGNITINGKLSEQPYTLRQSLNYTVRESNFYDFGLYATAKFNGESFSKYLLLKNSSIDFSFDYNDIDFIGKTQAKYYSFAGGKMKWSMDFVYETSFSTEIDDIFFIFIDTVTRQDIQRPENIAFGNELVPDYTTASTNPPIFYGDDLEIELMGFTGTSNFCTDLLSIYNNYVLNSSPIYGLGYAREDPFSGHDDPIEYNAYRLIENVKVARDFPLSTITISGEKVFG
jgi:hypothetical protein